MAFLHGVGGAHSGGVASVREEEPRVEGVASVRKEEPRVGAWLSDYTGGVRAGWAGLER